VAAAPVAVAPPAAAPSTSPAVVAPPATAAAAPAADLKQNFGLSEAAVAQKEVAAGARPKEITRIEAHITAISLSGAGLTTFTLDNGQVWRQLSAEGDLLTKPGDLVTVSRGMLRSYWLQAKNGRGCKVTRIA
ncbi:MAG: hypothetical protein WBF21_22495, partial [Steroidobacteraceae bacterium]